MLKSNGLINLSMKNFYTWLRPMTKRPLSGGGSHLARVRPTSMTINGAFPRWVEDSLIDNWCPYFSAH